MFKHEKVFIRADVYPGPRSSKNNDHQKDQYDEDVFF